MLSVLLINSEIYEYYQKYACFFNWFEDHSDVAICIWNKHVSEDADLDELAPQLFDLVKNVSEWNAFIIDEPYVADEYLSNDFKNLTQYAINPYERAGAQKEYAIERDQLLRLTYFLGGRGVEELEYIQNYRFKAVRPTQIYLATPRIFEDLEMQKKFLESAMEEKCRRNSAENAVALSDGLREELLYSDFWSRYDYPPNCRFLTFDLPSPSSARYDDAWFMFWLALMTLLLNTYSSAELGAYKLYRLAIDISPEAFKQFLNRFYGSLVDACEILQKDIENEVSALKAEIADTSKCSSIETTTIHVNFSNTDVSRFFPDGDAFGLTKDQPKLDTEVWYQHRKEAENEAQTMFQSVDRGKAEAINAMYSAFEADLELLKKRQLNQFEVERLQRELAETELAMLALETDMCASWLVFEKEIKKAAKPVEKAMCVRTKTSLFLKILFGGVGLCVAGFLPFIISSAKFNLTSFLIALVISGAAGVVVGVSALIALKIRRMRFDVPLDDYSHTVSQQLTVVENGATIQGKYLTLLLSYMEKYQLLKTGRINEKYTQRLKQLAHSRAAYEDAVEQCRSVAGLCHITLAENTDDELHERMVFEPGAKIYLHADTDSMYISFNSVPNRLMPPFPFVDTLYLEEEILYESPAYRNYAGNTDDVDTEGEAE